MDSTSSTYPKDRLAHAHHNQKAAIHLYNDGACHFPDWVITTAFYAALNYVKHKVFPIGDMQSDGKFLFTYTFEDYLIQNNKEREDKHSVIRTLVKQHCSPIRAEYDKLLDMCWGARYVDYKRTPEEALAALELLSKIAHYCDKEKAAKQVQQSATNA